MAMRGPRLQVGSAAWVAEERSCALQVAQSEAEEFSFSARNELEWLNEHMSSIFNENEINLAETFKTPGKLRGKTPRTARKGPIDEARMPLSDVFATTPNAIPTKFDQQLSRMRSPQIQAVSPRSPSPAKSTVRTLQIFSPKASVPLSFQDSGYHGSQDLFGSQNTNINDPFGYSEVPDSQGTTFDQNHQSATNVVASLRQSPPKASTIASPDEAIHASQGHQATESLHSLADEAILSPPFPAPTIPTDPREEFYPGKINTAESSPAQDDGHGLSRAWEREVASPAALKPSDETHSPSDGSSPDRPVVRKSILNFASLPAREPLGGGKKSTGGRVSRTSHLDHNRTSYYSRPTGGKSLGNPSRLDADEEDHEDDMDLDDEPTASKHDEKSNLALNHNKAYTQRLQDQISLLGKTQANASRPSKSIPNLAALQQSTTAQKAIETPRPPPAPAPMARTKTTPGAFPADDEDDWIDPPVLVSAQQQVRSPRPVLAKSYTADVMEGIHKDGTIGGAGFGHDNATVTDKITSTSPLRKTVPRSSGVLGHGKSASVSVSTLMPRQVEAATIPLTKAASIANPKLSQAVDLIGPETPSKSPSRSLRDSPLKHVKNKLSSILKSSKSLLASSAAISAEGKSSLLSPSVSRFGLYSAQSTESVVPKPSLDSLKSKPLPQLTQRDASPTRPVAKRTRASTEREKEEKRREKEAKLMDEQMGKLDKAREKEREKARVFSKEKEKITTLEQQITRQKQEIPQPPVSETPRTTRSSPRKVDVAEEPVAHASSEDAEMHDAPLMPPPSVPRSAAPAHHSKVKDIKRPMKPSKEIQSKTKPTLIRVNTTSQNPQPYSSNTSFSTASESVRSSTSQSTHHVGKVSKPSLQHKSSAQSLKSGTPGGRPKALELAMKKKEQDERDAQRRREAKVEMERKRAAALDEQRKQEQQRRLEVERQKQRELEQASRQADAKKNAMRQEMINKAKETKAPPPAPRSQLQSMYRAPDDSSRPVNAVLSTATKAGVKRTLGQEGNDDGPGRPPSRVGTAYKDAKRRRTSDEHRAELGASSPPTVKGPAVRPSAGFKELPKKSLFQNGYAQAPPNTTRDLFKATVTAQHQSHTKSGNVPDMSQFSKGAIPFAPNGTGTSHKTPGRPGAPLVPKSAMKSAQRSSPRFQNGESIELPEIQTDDEDEDEDDGGPSMAAPWADSPKIREALERQETMDPSLIFGPPAPLVMEEVFNKSKEKWHKFRQRTSSANWHGTDRLTEDDIRKDMAARDKMRRDGGWSYEMSKEML